MKTVTELFILIYYVCVGDANIILLLITLQLLVSGNKRERNETLTQCAEWSQFTVDYFFR